MTKEAKPAPPTEPTPEPVPGLRGYPHDPDAPDHEGFDAYVPNDAAEPWWLEATIRELNGQLVTVEFPKRDGGTYAVTVSNPAWNCDPAAFESGDTIHVKVGVHQNHPAGGVVASVAGDIFFPAVA